MSVLIRKAVSQDAEILLDIYRPYVENTAISFEYKAPDIHEFRCRMDNLIEKYPYIAAEEQGQIVGYAYLSAFNERQAYARSVETTIYIRQDCRGMGYGSKLYTALEKMLQEQNFLNMYACIAYTDREDEYLTNASMRFHESMGFKTVGHFHSCGYKFGRWYDMLWMEKFIGEHKVVV